LRLAKSFCPCQCWSFCCCCWPCEEGPGRRSCHLKHPEVAPDKNGSEYELRPTATYRKDFGGFRFDWGADFFAAVRSVVGTAARRGVDAYRAIADTLRAQSVLTPA